MRLVRIAMAGAVLVAFASIAALRGRETPTGTTAATLLGGGAGTLHVDAAAHSDDLADGSPSRPFRTISAALRAAPSGTTISVGAGLYRERLALTRWVSIVGGGPATTRLVAPPNTQMVVALVGATRLSLRGIAVEGGLTGIDVSDARNVVLHDVALRGQGTAAIRVRGGAIELVGGEVIDVGSTWTGTGLSAENAIVRIKSSVFRRAGRRAIHVRASSAHISDADVEGSALSAVQATHRSDVVVERGHFAANGGAALYAGDSKLRVVGSVVESNDLGIVGFRGARLDIDGAQVFDHQVAGIAVTGGTIRVRNAFVSRGGTDAAISVTDSKDMVIEDTTIMSPGTIGVHVTESRGVLRGNDIRGARSDRQRDFGDGVFAARSNVTLDGNVLRGNAGSGVASMNSTLRLARNDLIANGSSGAILHDHSILEADGNLFDRNRRAGLQISERSRARLRHNRFVQAPQPAIAVDWCRDDARRGSAELGDGNSFAGGDGRLSCL